jgi:hypothetical protein
MIDIPSIISNLRTIQQNLYTIDDNTKYQRFWDSALTYNFFQEKAYSDLIETEKHIELNNNITTFVGKYNKKHITTNTPAQTSINSNNVLCADLITITNTIELTKLNLRSMTDNEAKLHDNIIKSVDLFKQIIKQNCNK